MKTVQEIVEQAMSVRPLTEINERECVAKWAMQVRPHGLIVEIGALYGGMTAVLGLAAPQAKIISIDDFSWHPADDIKTSAELLYANMEKVGVTNVKVLEGDSRILGLDWDIDQHHIDFVFIDGGHSYDWVISDLMLFGSKARVIALHDYGNEFWASIKQAVDDFLRFTAGAFVLEEVVGTIAILRRA